MKLLVIRLGAMGDVVLTTPVLRCVKQQLPGAELHYLTRPEYSDLLAHNPNIDKLHTLLHNDETTVEELKAEAFDVVIDLQNNEQSKRIQKVLGIKKSYAMPQRRLQKALFTRLKWNVMPNEHVVDRYLQAVAPLRVTNDGNGLDVFIPKNSEVPLRDIPASHSAGYIAFVIGASQFTKRLPAEQWQALCARIQHPIILMGGKDAFAAGEAIKKVDDIKVYNACGKFSILESADLLRRAKLVVTGDTGLMHIAAALKKPIITIWGSTTPSLGMAPYYGSSVQQRTLLYAPVQVHKLWCRPCTTVGLPQCPQGHFKCMKNIAVENLEQKIIEKLQAL